MALESVDALSDDDTTLALSPSAGDRQVAHAAAKAKAKPAAKPKAVGKSEASPKPKGVPKTKPPVLKRPASSGSAGSGMKRPAAAKSKQKDPDRISVGESMYKKNGVWCIKLSGKEVVRVSWLHLIPSCMCKFVQP